MPDSKSEIQHRMNKYTTRKNMDKSRRIFTAQNNNRCTKSHTRRPKPRNNPNVHQLSRLKYCGISLYKYHSTIKEQTSDS